MGDEFALFAVQYQYSEYYNNYNIKYSILRTAQESVDDY